MAGLTDERPDTGSAGLRRYVTILFSDLSGSTQLGDVMEAEHYVDMLGVVRSLCREIIFRHGGNVARLQGDGLLAVFGFPESREDDGRRAAEAALELHAAVGSIALSGHAASTRVLALHSGIHAGLTYVRSGDAETGTLEVLGEVPNAAANLSSLAARGEIVVSVETLGPAVHFFDTEAPQVIALKGRARPLEICRVLRRRPAHRRLEARAVRGLAPFVGREAELGMLVGCLNSAASGEARCVAVLGGPGLGKTRLVEEVMQAARAAGHLVLHGYCESYLSAEPMQPFVQVLRATAPPAVHEGGHRSETDPGAATSVDAVAARVDELASRQPVLLVLDDWQWADELSQRALDAVLALPRSIFVLIASRVDGSESVVPERAQAIELGPLDLDQTRRTLAHLLPGTDPFVVAEIHRHAGGVPLFIEELCHSAASRGFERAPTELPAPRLTSAAWLAALVESRVNRLAPEQRAIVSAAAVLGNVFPGWLLERITGHGEASPLVTTLAARDFIFSSEQPGMMRFKHGVTRDVIYHAVGLAERMALHLRVAETLAARHAAPGATNATSSPDAPHDDAFEALAYHYAAAGVPEQAARFAELAGDKALAAFALDRARAQYGAALQAMDALAPLPRSAQLAWCGLAGKLGMACVWDPLALADGVALFERAVALAREAGDDRALARAEYWLGYIHYAKGNSREALTHCERALELATGLGDERLADQVRATLGQALAAACRYERALELLGTALDSKRSRGRPGSAIAVGSAYALACKGSVLGDRGLFAQAEECFADAMALVGSTDHQVGSSVRNWIAAVYQWQGRWQEAEDIAVASIRIAEHCKSRQLMAMSRALWGHAHWATQRGPEALTTVLEATRWIESRKGALVTSLNYGWLVAGAAAEGRLDDARRHAARLFVRARQHDRLGEAMGCRALAQMAAGAGRFDVAEGYLAQAARAARARGSLHEQASNRLAVAGIAAGRGRTAEAHAQLDEASAAFESMAMHWHLGEAEALRKRL
jgi:class 3 adenylate cyclase/tetratricopeptide (TPR) repeat protein